VALRRSFCLERENKDKAKEIEKQREVYNQKKVGMCTYENERK
jgi:hypothetical protein